MTCIVGLVDDDGSVWIGGDSAGVNGRYDMVIRADQKVWKKDGWAFGFTSSFRMGQLLRYSFSPPRYHPDDDLYKHMVTGFVNGVRQTLKDGGWARKDSEQERGGTFLVGYQGRLFQIEGDYQVGEAVRPFDAVGCGYAYALGSLRATATIDMDPEARVRAALEAAAEMSAGVAPPFHVVSLEQPQANGNGR